MGKAKRLMRIFQEDGNAIITAMDHGVNSGPMAGIERLDETMKNVIAAGTDAILCNIGMAKRYEEILGRVGVIVRVDFPCTDFISGSRDSELHVTVEEAVRAGADAVLYNGGPDATMNNDVMLERAFVKMAGVLRRDCDRYGMPLFIEVVPGGFNPPATAINVNTLKLGARVAAELGADALKMPYRGPGYEEVVDGCQLPIVVLGGAKTNSQKQFFTDIDSAMKAGARGVAIGRNLWGHEHPDRFVGCLKGLIHEGLDLEEAYKRFDD